MSFPEELREDILNNPENLDLVNYILNQDFVGMSSTCNGLYTWGDIQQAIWVLVEEKMLSNSHTGAWSQCRVNEIIANAIANGEGFVPSCGDVIAIILEPQSLNQGQVSIIELPILCHDCETAWGDGTEFNSKNWATYIVVVPLPNSIQGEQWLFSILEKIFSRITAILELLGLQ